MKTAQEWNDELSFINSVDADYPGRSFNWSRECFAQYCEMQFRACRKAGFPNIAAEIMRARARTLKSLKTARVNNIELRLEA